MKAGKDK